MPMKQKGIIAIIFGIIFFASCIMNKTERYNTVFRLPDYGKPKSLKETDKPFLFRYWVANEQIEIWSDDSVHFFGKIFCYTARHDQRKMKFYGVNFHIPDSLTSKIVMKFNDLKVLKTLAQKDTGRLLFSECSDCGGVDYEYCCRKYYINKSSTWPTTGNKVLDSFGYYIEQTIDIEKNYWEFIDFLPYRTYQRNMIEVRKVRPK